MARLSANQEILLLLMIDEADRWWTAAAARVRWPTDSAPNCVALGIALRGLWSRGLTHREHGPPSSYRLNHGGKLAAKELKNG